MKNTNTRFLVLFAAIAILVFAVGVGLRERKAGTPDEGRSVVDGGAGSTADGISVAPLPDGDEVVANATAGYYFAMPSNWYTEKSGNTELAVYPDYDPNHASSSPPTCKIEISSFAAAKGTELDGWITKYLHADPTASVAEVSRMPIAIGDTGAGISGIEWRGALNGVTTTLVYAEMQAATSGNAGAGDTENSSTKIFEIAPSTLSEAGDADNDDCDLVLQALVANFKFGAYEP